MGRFLGFSLLIWGWAFGQTNLDLQFSLSRGFYNSPQILSLSTSAQGASIYYTLNGQYPHPDSATLYQLPISINGTQIVRALAILGADTSVVQTHSYLFVNDIINQPNTLPYFPGGMALDNSVLSNAQYSSWLPEAFLQIPSLSFVMEPEDFYGEEKGIYKNPSAPGDPAERGRNWERAVSVEFIDPSGQEENFQINAGTRIHGNFTRIFNKKNFRLYFRSEYGASKLEYPILGPEAADEFDQLILRAGSSYPIDYRDQLVRTMQLEMDQYGSRGRYLHLYINGQYWGIYNLCERLNDDFVTSYFGGESLDWDVVKGTGAAAYGIPLSLEAQHGEMATWQILEDIAYNEDLDDSLYYHQVLEYMDMDNFIDYLLTNNYTNTNDWTTKNAVWAYDRKKERGFYFLNWDANTLTKSTVKIGGGPFNQLYEALKQNDDFRLRFADHLYCECYHDGMFTDSAVSNLLNEMYMESDTAMLAEAARWDNLNGYINDVVGEVDDLLTNLIPGRYQLLIDGYRNTGVYPNIDPVVMSQEGGEIPQGYSLSLGLPSGVQGAIYFTTDGSDPRLYGGAVAPGAQIYSGPITLAGIRATVIARIKSGNEWSAACPRVFYQQQDFSQLALQEIHYQPHSEQGENTEFLEIVNHSNNDLFLQDCYLEGGVRFSFPSGSLIESDSLIVLARDSTAFHKFYGFAPDGEYAGKLSDGGECLRLMDPQGNLLDQVCYEDQLPWPLDANGLGPSMEVYPDSTNDVPGNWHANGPIGGTPGKINTPNCVSSSGTIAFHEIYPAFEAPWVNLNAGDWLELFNPDTILMDLSNWKFQDGDSAYHFPSGTYIEANGYLLLVQDSAAFDLVHPNLNRIQLDLWGLKKEGERLNLYEPGGCIIDRLIYGRGGDWPSPSDGHSLLLNQEVQSNEFPVNWSEGDHLGGNPGRANDFCADQASVPIVINEIHYQPLVFENSGDWVELYNPSWAAVDLSNWKLYDKNHRFSVFPNTLIASQGFLVMVEEVSSYEQIFPGLTAHIGPIGFGLSNVDESLILVDDQGCLIDAVSYSPAPPWPGSPNGFGASLSLIDPSLNNLSPNSWMGNNPSPEAENGLTYDCESKANIEINEIHYNSPTIKNGGNWLEIFNADSAAFNLSNWSLQTQDTVFYFPLNQSLAAGDYLVLVENAAAFQNLYPGINNYVGDMGFGLDNGGGTILLVSDQQCIIDSVVYSDQAPWPIYADGIGASLALKQSGFDPNQPENWFASFRQGTPGLANNSSMCLNLPKVMFNELQTFSQSIHDPGDWVELYQQGGGWLDMTNWSFVAGMDRFYVPEGFGIHPYDYLVLVEDSSKFEMTEGSSSNYTGDWDFDLNLEGEVLLLLDTAYCLVDSIHYLHSQPWPEWDDEIDWSISLVDPLQDNQLGESWIKNTAVSPGLPNPFSCGPGSVLSDLVVWLRPEELIGLEGQKLVVWPDASSGDHPASQVNSSKQPLIVGNGINGHTSVLFSGTHFLQLADAPEINSVDKLAYKAAFTVFETSGDISNQQVIFEEGDEDIGWSLYIEDGELFFQAWHFSNPSWSDESYQSPIQPNTAYLVSFIVRGNHKKTGVFECYLNGQKIAEIDGIGRFYDHEALTIGAISGSSYFQNGGNTDEEGSYLEAKLYEFLYFQSDLTGEDRIRVETYLHTKYGISIPGDRHHYYDKNAYGHHITGLGKDLLSCLDQDSAENTQTAAILSINTSQSLEHHDYLYWGENGGTFGDLTEDSPIDFRTGKCWYIWQAGRVGPVNLTFDLTGLIAADSETDDFHLLISQSESQFGTAQYVQADSLLNDQLVFMQVELQHGDYISLSMPGRCQPDQSGAELLMWLRADAGLESLNHGDDVSLWLDQSGLGNDASMNILSDQPTFLDQRFNGNPTLYFDGVEDWMRINSIAGGLEDTATVFVVLKGYQDTDDGYYLATNNNGSNRIKFGYRQNGELIYDDDVPSLSTENHLDQALMISLDILQDELVNGYINGSIQNPWTGFTSDNANQASIGQEFDGQGNDNQTSNHWHGELAEMIVYNHVLPLNQKNEVRSYLSIKYGLSIPFSQHIYYPYSSHSDHMAGLGQSALYCLDQSSSRNSETGSILRVSNPDDLGGGEFLVWGSDGAPADAANASTNVPIGMGSRLQRTWRFAETGELETVRMDFDLTGLNWENIPAGNWQLLQDDDGDFSDAQILNIEAIWQDSTLLRFDHVNLVDGKYMALGIIPHIRLRASAILQGPYDIISGTMLDGLRENGLIPLAEPYSSLYEFDHGGGELMEPEVLNIIGPDAVVDWVLVEIRNINDPSQVIESQAGLIHRNGLITAADGISDMVFSLEPDSFYVAIRHRNHLAVMTGQAVWLDENSANLDFSDPGMQIYGHIPRRTISPGIMAMWAGNANKNESVIFQSIANDPNAIFLKVLIDPGNTTFSRNYIVTAYASEDVNLDGKVIFQGANADTNPIFLNVLSHPDNGTFNRNFIISQQLP